MSPAGRLLLAVLFFVFLFVMAVVVVTPIILFMLQNWQS